MNLKEPQIIESLTRRSSQLPVELRVFYISKVAESETEVIPCSNEMRPCRFEKKVRTKN